MARLFRRHPRDPFYEAPRQEGEIGDRSSACKVLSSARSRLTYQYPRQVRKRRRLPWTSSHRALCNTGWRGAAGAILKGARR